MCTRHGVETSQQPRKEMIDHYHRDKKPFKVGQLIKCRDYPGGLFIVLGFEWDSGVESWYCVVYSQKKGKKTWVWSHSHVAAEENK